MVPSALAFQFALYLKPHLLPLPDHNPHAERIHGAKPEQLVVMPCWAAGFTDVVRPALLSATWVFPFDHGDWNDEVQKLEIYRH